ncbi:MAG: D-alanyl-D-alanine carboxypeptidase family protein [Clostridiales bacterium]|jgi:D-alanyl-D-alanine carboxypeptidase|nr:D-alanyl-D-alanine carboxypeptidase family protein [Clostridiales bacterium]MCI2022368.1 D-alanyl-D-alanine carboxypeptidase family protein [Clostridiales bacterium]MCI2026765.1 D-alanyl-D-alanine carboxypeptidase family protein [Clostridiales bacterium]MCI2192065.1 D-alanyl-D-alanine carboxypeptidase family protein [Oscillospiraceae bacterium]MCI2205476.1 D-alanyl-D-alanine carboxypeptidase family protein [Oscillospiraceae bacterium]
MGKKRTFLRRNRTKFVENEDRTILVSRRVLLVLILIVVLAGIFLCYRSLQEIRTEEDQKTVSSQAIAKEPLDPSLLTVISSKFPCDKEEKPPQLTTVSGVSVNIKIADALKQFLAAAKKAGYSIQLKSGYINADDQEKLYQEKVSSLISGGGYTQVRAEAEAAKTVPPGNACEDALGLSFEVDGDSDFKNSAAAKWLDNQCVFYGFIRRYPESKTEYTGMSGSFTHYRYVGEESAMKMRSYGMCLEEYVSYLKQSGTLS